MPGEAVTLKLDAKNCRSLMVKVTSTVPPGRQLVQTGCRHPPPPLLSLRLRKLNKGCPPEALKSCHKLRVFLPLVTIGRSNAPYHHGRRCPCPTGV